MYTQLHNSFLEKNAIEKKSIIAIIFYTFLGRGEAEFGIS